MSWVVTGKKFKIEKNLSSTTYCKEAIKAVRVGAVLYLKPVVWRVEWSRADVSAVRDWL